MVARSIVFAMANSTILDHLLPFAPKHANGSIGAASGVKLRRRIEAIVAIVAGHVCSRHRCHFAVGVLKSC
jgi:hypothetical protein